MGDGNGSGRLTRLALGTRLAQLCFNYTESEPLKFVLPVTGETDDEAPLCCTCRAPDRWRGPANVAIRSSSARATLHSGSYPWNTWSWPAASGGPGLRSGALGALRPAQGQGTRA